MSVVTISRTSKVCGLKEVIVFGLSMGGKQHELELLNIKYSHDVFVLLDQVLVTKMDRRTPKRIEVGGSFVTIYYSNGEFSVNWDCSVTSTTTASTACESQAKRTKNAYFAAVKAAKARCVALK